MDSLNCLLFFNYVLVGLVVVSFLSVTFNLRLLPLLYLRNRGMKKVGEINKILTLMNKTYHKHIYIFFSFLLKVLRVFKLTHYFTLRYLHYIPKPLIFFTVCRFFNQTSNITSIDNNSSFTTLCLHLQLTT